MTLHFPLNPWAKNVLEFICHAPSILSPHIYILRCNIQVICLSRYYVYIVSATATITLFCRLRVTFILSLKTSRDESNGHVFMEFFIVLALVLEICMDIMM